MGICGSGKSTVARELAGRLEIEMLDADDFHPLENIEKMRSGTPLTDADRAGWLRAINAELRRRRDAGSSLALACSALKRRYREALASGGLRCAWIYLKADRATALERMAGRPGHFMPAALVDSQLSDLEEPEGAVVLDVRLPVEQLLARALAALESPR